MDLFQLWAFAPGGDEPTILPQPMKVDAGFVLSDVSSMTITYPLDAPGHELLDDYCDVELRYRSGDEWVCPSQGRFLVADWQTDPVQESVQPTRTYTLVSWGWLLSGVLQSNTVDLDSSGNREFINMSPAEVVETLIDEALTAGFCDTFTVENLASTGGWAPSYAPGKAVSDILSESRDQGFLEWLIQPDAEDCGRKLVLYDSVGVDRSTGDNPVTLRIGRDLVQAPSKRSMRDLAPSALGAGDNGHYAELTNPGADLPYGFMQTYVSAAGITDLGALEVVLQARLDKGATVRAELTRQVRFETAEFLPLLDYGLGDTILAPDDQGQLVPLRVRQITLTFDGRWSGNLVLGDRFSERVLAMDRRVRQLTAPSVWGGGRPVAAPAPPIQDNTTPPVSSALTATSKLGTVTLTWNGKDENGQDVAAGFDHAEAERDTSGSFSNPVVVGEFQSRRKIDDAGLTIGATYYYRLVIVNAAGVRAAAGAAVPVTVVGVKGPDLEANSVTANKMNVGQLSSISADLGTVNVGTLNGVDIKGSTFTGGLFRTASSGARIEISSSSAGSIAFIDSSGNGGAIAVSTNGVQLQTPSASGFPGILALSETGFSVSLRGGTVLSFPAPQSSNNSSIFSGGGMSITANGNLNLNGSSVNINGSSAVTGSVVRPGDGISTSSNVSAFRLITTSPRSSSSSSPLYWNTANEVCLLASSSRFKTDIADSPDPERVLDLRAVAYRYKEDPDGEIQYGLIAEEVVDVYPSLVSFDEGGLPRGVDYARGWVNLIPIVKILFDDYKARSAA